MHTSIERPLRLEGRPARAPSIRPAHERWARRPRAVSTAAAAAHRALEFPQRGSGLLWARSTGLKLWPGALLLARAVEASDQDPQLLAALHPSLAAAQRRGHHHDTPPWRWSDKLVLELGCGLGLVACTAAQLGARVVATDGDADLLRVSAKNIAHNTVGPGGALLTRHPVRTAQLLWGDERQLRAALAAGRGEAGPRSGSGAAGSNSGGGGGGGGGGEAAAAAGAEQGTEPGRPRGGPEAAGGPADVTHAPADVILMSDVVYGSDPGLWEKLVSTLSAASGPGTLLLQAETKRLEGVLYPLYFEMLDAAGFDRSPVPEGLQAALRDDLRARGQWNDGAECSLWALSRRGG